MGRLGSGMAAAALALLGAGAVQAAALPAGGVTPEEFAAALKSKGMAAEIRDDAEGDPMIVSGTDGTTFRVHFYECSPARRCTSTMFSVGFDYEGGVTAAKVNQWNRTKRFLRAWVDDEQDPYAVMDVDFEKGATSELIVTNIETWALILPMFKAHFNAP